jgi:hypothetical protein
VSESDWSSDYEEFVEKNDRNDPQKEEKTRETTPRPTIPSKYRLHCKKGSVADPHWFQYGSDPAFFVNLDRDTDPDPDPGI